MNELESKIAERIHEFDIISLLRLLHSIGYKPEEIRFRSNNSICSQSALIHGINFCQAPVREVIICLNIGLLSAQSPLPSYFRQNMESEVNNLLSDFIGYFDNHLIKDYIFNVYPELNDSFFSSWDSTARRYLQVLDLTSCSTLHWLFKLVFPEISVYIEKTLLNEELLTQQLRIGETTLGEDAVFGASTRVPIHGRRITLSTYEECTSNQKPWPQEINQRLESLLFPVLRPTGIDLEITLVLKSQKRWARLEKDTYLGYDRIKNDQQSYRRIMIFKGHVGEYESVKKAENSSSALSDNSETRRGYEVREMR